MFKKQNADNAKTARAEEIISELDEVMWERVKEKEQHEEELRR